MSRQNSNTGDPLAMVRKMWSNMGFGLPGMVIPTLDGDELEKRISDLRAVEGWLSMNLSMLQMTIRSLEMQKTTLDAVRTMSEMAAASANASSEALAGNESPATPDNPGALWPWGLMQQVQEYMQRQAAEAVAGQADPANPGAESKGAGGKKSK
jgi:hypothetical protein